MNEIGKAIRMRRLLSGTGGTSIIFAIDHGMTAPTMLDGLADTPLRVRQAVAGGANVVMLSRGFLGLCTEALGSASAALLLSASAAGLEESGVVVPIGSVAEAAIAGADAVVVFVALGGRREDRMIEFVGQVGEQCAVSGMPFIAEAEYPTTYASVEDLVSTYGKDYLLRNARLCAELGADIVKVNWSGDAASFARIVEFTGVPVVVAGGSVIDEEEFLHRLELARQAGAIGCSVGRNIFEYPDPERITRAIVMVMGEEATAKEALAFLREPVMEAAVR